jgi:DNA-binding NtrC family response regulator
MTPGAQGRDSMSGDLVSLSLLLVAAAPPRENLWREGAAQASVPIEFEGRDAAAAKALLSRGGVDICVLDGSMADADMASVIKAARRAKSSMPLVFSSAPRGRARIANVDGVLPVPPDADDACKLVELCIRARMPTQVLVAGDSDALRRIVRKLLAASRFELDIHEAVDSSATLGKLQRSSISIVFLDANMPGLNGADNLMRIKRQNPDVKIVMMATEVEKTASDRRRLAEVLVLKMPFYQADIDIVLERYFGLHGAK